MAEKEEKEEKGFVIKDRRMFSSEEPDQQEPEMPPVEEPGRKESESAKQQFHDASHKGEGRPLPEVSLATFVFSLSSSALVHLGEIPDPDTEQVRVDLPLAKQIIDTLGMLQDKTRGNLEPDEESLMKSVLYDLRMRYVQKSSGK
jgi:hypothetical protein